MHVAVTVHLQRCMYLYTPPPFFFPTVLPVFFRMNDAGPAVSPDRHVPLTSSNMPAPERMSGPLTSHYLMDMASLLPPLLLGPRPGDRVGDARNHTSLAIGL